MNAMKSEDNRTIIAKVLAVIYAVMIPIFITSKFNQKVYAEDNNSEYSLNGYALGKLPVDIQKQGFIQTSTSDDTVYYYYRYATKWAGISYYKYVYLSKSSTTVQTYYHENEIDENYTVNVQSQSNGWYYSTTSPYTIGDNHPEFDATLIHEVSPTTIIGEGGDIEGEDEDNQTANYINYSLPAGNIAIIETNNNYSYVNLTTTMPLQSTSFTNNPWPNTTQRIGYYSTLPQTLNPNIMGNMIEWERNGNTTLFNITTSAKYNPNVVSTFKYVVIANPYYYPANDMEDSQYTNGAINISMDGVVNITVKSLTATVNTQTGAVEDNYNGTEWTGQVDETTNDIIWTDGNGENNAPTSGGNLSDPSISGFQSWLKGIMNNIVNIFQPAHDAINTLSGAVSNFASWMYALYVWLPSPILSLLTSAISLAIVIGIIKVFI